MRILWATLRHRPAPLVGTLVALATASLMVTCAFSLGEAANGTPPVHRLAGTAVVVTGRTTVPIATGRGSTVTTQNVSVGADPPVPASLARTLRPVPGARRVVADRSVPLALTLAGGRTVPGPGGAPIEAHGWPSAVLTPCHLVAGHPPAGPHQLVVGTGLARRAGLAVGDRVRVTGRSLSPFTVVGVAAGPPGDAAGVGGVYLSGPEAAALTGHPRRADLIGVVAAPGVRAATLAARVRAALPPAHLVVRTGPSRGTAEAPAVRAQLATLSVLAGSAGTGLVTVSLFVVAGAVALAVAERARTLALLRAVGATPGQVRRGVMGELAVLGMLGGLVGFLPGLWVAGLSMRGLVAHHVVPASTHPWTSPVGLVPSVLAGVVVAEIAGFLAARRASRVAPAAALREATVERRVPRPLRLLLGIAAAGGGAVASVLVLREPDPSQQVQLAQLVLLAWMAALAFLGPYLMVVVELALRLPLRLVGRVPGRLGGAELRARARRMAAAVVAIAMPVAFAGALLAIDATAAHGSGVQSRERLAATAVVTAPAPGLGPSALGAVRSQPGVTGAVGLVPTTVYLAASSESVAPAVAVTPGPLGSLLHLGVTAGSVDHLGPGEVALSRLVAGRGGMGVHVGDPVTVHLADGTPYRATVAAVYDRSLAFGDVVLPVGAAGGGHLGTASLGTVLATGAAPGGGPPLAATLASLAGRYPGLHVADRAVANAQSVRLTAQTAYVNDLLLWLIGALAAVALVNTLVVATLQRREELVLLARVGATARQLLAATAWQAATVALVGAVLGAGAAAAVVAAVSRALTGSWTPHLPWPSLTLVLGLVVALTALATLVPAARMSARATVAGDPGR